MSDYGKPLYPDLQYCTRCCMPETNMGIKFDEMGICQSCQSSEQKIHINWQEREKELKKIFEKRKNESGNNYDCIMGISGGKDSTFQLHVITKVYKLNPLVVTFNHTWLNDAGEYNIKNSIEKFNVDHLMFTPRKATVDKLSKKSLSTIGDVCWHCHAGIDNFVMQTAVRYKIPLIIYGESAAEFSGRATHYKPLKFDRNYFLNNSSKVKAEEMIGDGIEMKHMNAFIPPPQKEYDEIGIQGIFLSDYIFWDDERQTEFVCNQYDWKEHSAEGTYKQYKSAGCKMVGVHDYAKFVKRGFGRGTDHASQDIRAGILTREEGFELAKKFDTQRPDELDNYLKTSGYTEKEFHDILKNQREGKAKNLP